MELERLYNALKTGMEEADARMCSHETQISELRNQVDTTVEKVTSMVSLQLQSKIEFSDLESLNHQLHAKVDFEKVQELMVQLKTEMVSQLAGVKKDVKKKASKKSEINLTTREQQEFANEKVFEEIRQFREKLTKLANQFDRELIERDKANKQQQITLWEDIQSIIQQIQDDIAATNQVSETLANVKADK